MTLTNGTLQERFWAKVAPADGNGCRIWIGKPSTDGYGRFVARGVPTPQVHRLAWEFLYGPIPEGLEIDHWRMNEVLMPGERNLCSKRCVEHLRLVTHRENSLASPRTRATLAAWAARHRSKTHCPQGHPYDAGNTYITPKTERQRSGRQCRVCKSISKARYEARQAEKRRVTS